ncbi:regulator [Xenorhabdus bovienii]|uniref:regulator n=2 Tax=Xenorhabdus bovienii TaxID=40576 RepID=UPI0023B2762B|nr:regulator [Xenorhabdus bovienii]MDE9528336.1 regulator [Xenorhabdus bovienii]MDE9571081.1 regulator [Xenorhabdus bovienii]
MNDIERIDLMISILRNLKTNLKKLKKLNEMDYRDLSPKQNQKRNTDADWIAMDNIKRRHELHALAVELGFADYRENYDEIELTDSWHQFSYKPREPYTS